MGKKIWDFYAPFYNRLMKKDELIYKLMYEKIIDIVKDKNVLELGTGTGLLAKNIANSTKSMIATDFSYGMINQAKKERYPDNLSFEVADAKNLPYDENEFDIVIIANALHIIPEPEKVLLEIDRVLNKDGILIAPNFIHNKDRDKSLIFSILLKLSGIKFENSWNEKSYIDFLNKNGWIVIEKKIFPTRVKLLYTVCKKAYTNIL